MPHAADSAVLLHGYIKFKGEALLMRKVLVLALAAASALLLAAVVAFGQGSSPGSDVDYHAEGQIIGGNIQIQTDRAPDQGQALTRCDPDPRPAPHARPDCAWATPSGSGREEVGLPGQIGRPDTDTSPNGSFTPDSSDTREILDGNAALDHGGGGGGPRFQGLFFGDEDMHFRLTPGSIDAYLAPEGDANNRWRRICGTGTVQQFNNSGGGNNDPRSPFQEGQVRKFVLQIWDADFREPSNADGGNQDFFIIDILAPGSSFNTSTCQAQAQQVQNPPAQPGQPAPPPAPLIAAAPSAAPARVAGTARLGGPGGCVSRAFRASVVGSRIAQVTFSLDGKRVKTLRSPTSGNRWSLQIVPRTLSRGVHRVSAGVSFRVNTNPRTRTLRLAFQRCAQAARRAPRFTG
jgi:hypothetical protein